MNAVPMDHKLTEGPAESWPALGLAAYHGLAGEVVRSLEPHTEADSAGLLVTFLAAAGAALGPGPHALADGAEHPPRLNIVLVGRSSRARKGTSWAVLRRVFERADPEFFGGHVLGGLASGEGLVAAVAAASDGPDPWRAGWLLVHEPEFARLLKVAARSATLSSIVREAWDGGVLSVLTRKEPLRAHGVHLGIVAHITSEELRRSLRAVEIANGMANRFLFGLVRRSKRLPDGGTLGDDDLERLGMRVRVALERGRDLGRVRRSREAEAYWTRLYHSFDDDVDGVVGSLTARAEAHVLRLSVAYAALDGATEVTVEHLAAAEAVWRYCEASVSMLFSESEEDDLTASRLLAALAHAPRGLDGTEQRDLFSRHASGTRLAAARRSLERRGLVVTRSEDTGGRPRLVTRLVVPPTLNNAPRAVQAATEGGGEGLWSLPSQPIQLVRSQPPQDPASVTELSTPVTEIDL